MSDHDLSAPAPGLLGRAAQTADHAIQATQAAANHALDGLSGSVGSLHAGAEDLSRRTQDAWNQGVQRARVGTRQATESARSAIRAEPLKAMLVAAGVGAALTAWLAWVTRPTRPRSGG